MAEVVIPYKPRELQLTLHDNLKRWNVVVCHRRFGKTVFAINELIKQALTCDKERPRYAYLAPTYKQAKTIAWDYLCHYSRVIPHIKINQSELRIDYPNGARIQLFGCDNPDALRGLYLDGCILDEYAQMPSSLFGEVIRPALSDRKGFAIFIGTPKGKNAFYDLYKQANQLDEWMTQTYRASESGLVDEEELADARSIMTEEEYEQEYECSWTAAIRGAVYGKEMATAYRDKRICFVPIEPSIEVHTFWDLGISDAMSIWFVQAVGKEIRLINYYENNNEGMQHYINYLEDFKKSHNIRYGDHFAPHDIEVRELTTGKSRRDTAREMGINFRVVRQHKVEDGIEAARRLFSRLWIDENRCQFGIECLSQYHYDYDEKKGVFKSNPVHDWASHCADSFRQIAMGWQDRLAQPDRNNMPTVQAKTDFNLW
ncbi:MAG: terminase large subunit domain-containing protein [Candidatus Nezhaarchaeales archaeon]